MPVGLGICHRVVEPVGPDALRGRVLPSIRSIAIIDPLGDYGIGGYTYELAEGLAANGVQVDVYTHGLSLMKDLQLARRHRLLPVLGSALFRQKEILESPMASRTAAPPSPASETAPGRSERFLRLRKFLVPLELALYLKRTGYDLVWTQWPARDYGVRFWALCKWLGLPLVHTVHNVLPHEEVAGDREFCGAIYKRCDWLVVHSDCARRELSDLFPGCARKVIVARHGLYTMYPRAAAGERAGVRRDLDISCDQTALLFFGGVRPYKNIDGVLGALRDPRCAQTVLVVSGKESGYPDLVPQDALGRTRKLAQQLGVADRVRLIPRHLNVAETAGLFAAADCLVLPYRKSYGSGLLLLGMTFGKHVIATRTGGIEEYLQHYPCHTLLEGPEAGQIAEGIAHFLGAAATRTSGPPVDTKDLEWPNVALGILGQLNLRDA